MQIDLLRPRRTPDDRRVRRVCGIWVVATVLVAGVVARPAQAVPARGIDWLLLRRPGDRALTVTGSGRLLGPPVIGWGISGPDGAAVRVWHVRGGSLSVRAGATSIEVRSSRSGRFTLRERLSSSRETKALLLFAANAVLDHVHITDDTWEHTYRGSVETGSGSRVVSMGSQDAAADTGAASGGMLGRSVRSGVGLAGAFDVSCVLCRGMWTSPVGTSGVFTSAWGPGTSGAPAFSGPPGHWTWSWTGIGVAGERTTSSPVVAAYAPIGSSWTLFADG